MPFIQPWQWVPRRVSIQHRRVVTLAPTDPVVEALQWISSVSLHKTWDVAKRVDEIEPRARCTSSNSTLFTRQGMVLDGFSNASASWVWRNYLLSSSTSRERCKYHWLGPRIQCVFVRFLRSAWHLINGTRCSKSNLFWGMVSPQIWSSFGMARAKKLKLRGTKKKHIILMEKSPKTMNS